MEKKKSIALIVFSLAAVYFLGNSLLFMWNAYKAHVEFSAIMPGAPEQFAMFLPRWQQKMPEVIIIFIMLIGIITWKSWAYFLLFLFSGMAVFVNTRGFLFSLQTSQSWDGSMVLGLFSIVFCLGLISFLLRQDTIQVFLGKNLKQYVSENRWSVGLLMISWILIWISLSTLERLARTGFSFNIQVFAFGWAYWVIHLIFSAGLLLRREDVRKIMIGILAYSIFIAIIQSAGLSQIVFFVIQNGLIIFFLTRAKARGLFT